MRKSILLPSQQDPADIIDFLTMQAEARRRVVRLPAEVSAAE
jgi:hypothetical protein